HTTVIKNVHLHAPQPFMAQLGIRYGLRRGTELETQLARGRRHDALATEIFDVEVDAVYEINSLVNDFTVSLPPGSSAYIPALYSEPAIPTTITLPHHWRDQLSL